MPPIQNTITEKSKLSKPKGKRKVKDIDAYMPSDREFLLQIMAEEAMEEEEFQEWSRDQLLNQMAREAVEEEEFERRCK